MAVPRCLATFSVRFFPGGVCRCQETGNSLVCGPDAVVASVFLVWYERGFIFESLFLITIYYDYIMMLYDYNDS